MNNLVVLVPCYNEEENILKVIEDIFKNLVSIKKLIYGSVDIVIIDDGSKDKSVEKVKLGQDIYNVPYLNIKLLENKKNMGLGRTINKGMEYFLENYSMNDKVIVIDGDASHKAKYMPKLIKKSEDFDVVICSRFRKGSEIHGVSLKRQFLSIGAGIYNKTLIPIKNVRDYTCGYRIYNYYSINLVKKKHKTIIKTKGFSCMVELLHKVSKLNRSIGEIPFALRYDEKLGESKMNVLGTLKDSLVIPLKLKRGL